MLSVMGYSVVVEEGRLLRATAEALVTEGSVRPFPSGSLLKPLLHPSPGSCHSYLSVSEFDHSEYLT